MNVPPPLISFWTFLPKIWLNFDMKNVKSCQVIVFSLDFVVMITSHVQKLINICISLTKRNVKHFKPLLLERSILTVEYIMLALLLSTVEPLYSGHAL